MEQWNRDKSGTNAGAKENDSSQKQANHAFATSHLFQAERKGIRYTFCTN